MFSININKAFATSTPQLLFQGITSAAVLTDTEGLLRIKEENQKHYRRAQRHQEKKEKIQRHNRKLGDLVEKKTYDLKTQYEHLAKLRRAHILELTSVIFPMEEVKTSMRYGSLVLLRSFCLALGAQKEVVSL